MDTTADGATPHAVTFATITVPVSFRLVPFTMQPLILSLASLQLGDQLLARGGAASAPARAGYART